MARPDTIEPNAEEHRKLPPLANGDRLSRPEFERRYDAMPGLKKAELIEGEVHMPSPVRWMHHGSPDADFVGWLIFYQAHTPGVDAAHNASIRLDMENEPQPDATMIVKPAYGGRVLLDEEDYVVGAPEFIGEISASTVNIDLHKKLRVYRRNQVQEYVVWRVLDQAFDWFTHRAGVFERILPDAAAIYRSEVFPGLWLDSLAMVRGDMARVFQVLQQGLASPEHAGFVAKLQAPQAGKV